MKVWLAQHAQSLRIALGRLGAGSVASLLSVLVIGVALSLPASLYVLLANAQRASGDLSARPEITVFLKAETGQAEGEALAKELARRPEVSLATFVHRDEALESLRQAGLGDVMAGLTANPLPHAITLSVNLSGTEGNPTRLEKLAAELAAHPNVERVSLDAEWARRLAAILDFGRELVWLLAVALSIALVAITGNTIRLQIYAQREEIEVSRLIGATDRFIRRPFLYFGLLQGLVGGLAAWAMVSLLIHLLDDSVAQLARAYGTHFPLAGLALPEAGVLLALAGTLGLAGAWLSVSQALRRLD